MSASGPKIRGTDGKATNSTSEAWEVSVLPLNYAGSLFPIVRKESIVCTAISILDAPRFCHGSARLARQRRF